MAKKTVTATITGGFSDDDVGVRLSANTNVAPWELAMVAAACLDLVAARAEAPEDVRGKLRGISEEIRSACDRGAPVINGGMRSELVN